MLKEGGGRNAQKWHVLVSLIYFLFGKESNLKTELSDSYRVLHFTNILNKNIRNRQQ